MKLASFVLCAFASLQFVESLVKDFTNFDRRNCLDVPPVKGLVINGKVTPSEKWPWVVALYRINQELHGGGSLISERFILTAAHCIQEKKQLEPFKPSDLTAFLGKWNSTDDTEENAVQVAIKALTIHPDWNLTSTMWEADIAMVELCENVKLNSRHYPVCLWTPETRLSTNDGGIVIGWGVTEKNNQVASELLRQGTLAIKPRDFCSSIDGLHRVMSSRGLCAGGDGVGPCSGDSGGGLFSARGEEWFLRGIVSISLMTASSTCDVDNPAVFTEVYEFHTWINTFLSPGDVVKALKCKFATYDITYYGCTVLYMDFSYEQKPLTLIGEKGNRDITAFDATNQRSKYLPINLGNFFPKLNLYHVNSANIKRVSRRNFRDLKDLKIVRLYCSMLETLPVDIFQDLVNLNILDLYNTRIEALDPDTFIHNSKLQLFDMSHNKIRSLSASLFRKNLNLQYISFAHNLLVTVDPILLNPLNNLKRVNFMGNPCTGVAFSKEDASSMSMEELRKDLGDTCKRV